VNKIGLSSFVLATPFTNDSLSLLPGVRHVGYDLLEVSVAELGVIDAVKLGRVARDSGLALRISGDFGPTRDISSGLVQSRIDGLDYLKACLDIAAEAGADMVTGPMHSAVGNRGYMDGAARRWALGWAAEGLSEAAERAGELGLRLALEPLNRFENNLINTVEQGLDLCTAVGSDHLGLALDTFHLNIEEKDLGRAIGAAGSRIFSFQASENDRGTPGSGHLPWLEIFAALRATAYEGPIIVESFRSDSTPLINALSLWRPVAASMDELARDALTFIRTHLS
jgi:D-psicose/D-tagatose/L-ribulose 3-epimerase